MSPGTRKVDAVMLIEGRPIQVNLSRLIIKRDNEGGKWATLGLTTVVSEDKAVKGAIAEAVDLMVAQASMDAVRIDEEMKGVRLEFYPVGAAHSESRRVFESTDLFEFRLAREKSTQAGTLRKEKSGRIVLGFHCTVPLSTAGSWSYQNFGNDIMVVIQKAQQELPLGGDEENSQPARNKRIKDGEREDAAKGKKKAKKR